MCEPGSGVLGSAIDHCPSYLLYPAPSGRSSLETPCPEHFLRPLPRLRRVTAQDWDTKETFSQMSYSSDDPRSPLPDTEAREAASRFYQNPFVGAPRPPEVTAELPKTDTRRPSLELPDVLHPSEKVTHFDSASLYVFPSTQVLSSPTHPPAPPPRPTSTSLSHGGPNGNPRYLTASSGPDPRNSTTVVGFQVAHHISADEIARRNPTGYKWIPYREWRCPMEDCDAQAFPRQSSLKGHLESVHSVKQELWVCELCGMETLRKGWLTNHRSRPCNDNYHAKLRR